MTEVSGFSVGTMPVLMLLAGASMCVGNYLGGHLSDRFTPGIVAMSMQFLDVCITSADLFFLLRTAFCPLC